jgi:hypothetical protein
MEEDPEPAALLRLSVALHLRDADAGDGEQSGPDVLRLGRRRACVLSADRFLVQKPSANAAAIKAFVVNRVGDLGSCSVFSACSGVRYGIDPRDPRGRAGYGRIDHRVPRDAGRYDDACCASCCSSARWANRRSLACTHGCPMRWKGRHRCPR